MRENKNLEFKEALTSKTWLKTVSAFANYGGGDIVFGVADNGDVIGVDDPTADRLSIEQAINDNISPRPAYEIEANPDTNAVKLHVSQGSETPYLYKGKAYRRSDTSTVQVDDFEFRRLALVGTNQTYDALPSTIENPTFNALETSLRTVANITQFDQNTLRTLELMTPDGRLNNAGALLADENDFPGIDIARFGNDISTILDRETYAGTSIITQLNNALSMFERYYQYDVIEGFKRETRERVPREAFREAVANALAHRVWDLRAHIRILMFDDRIEVASPGGLPRGIREQDYHAGNLSVFRNPILGRVLERLNIIEYFGTGVLRIKRCYEGLAVRPSFSISESALVVTLPTVDAELDLTSDELRLLDYLEDGLKLTTAQISERTGLNPARCRNLLKQLEERGVVVREGQTKGTRWSRANR